MGELIRDLWRRIRERDIRHVRITSILRLTGENRSVEIARRETPEEQQPSGDLVAGSWPPRSR